MEIKNIPLLLRCHKCRHIVYDFHSMTSGSCDLSVCGSYDVKNFIYLQEDKLPSWIKSRIECEQWTKGKLMCENCGYKVGSFDFVSGRKCECGASVLPSVHFISSQVDRPIHVDTIQELNTMITSKE